jgi:hypothetical protein
VRWSRKLVWAVLGIAALAAAIPAAVAAGKTGPRVLLVGTYHGSRGQFRSIQAAVDAAHPGDWILIAPGDYHERGDHRGTPGDKAGAGVTIGKAQLHIRGLDRNGVVIDGSRPGAKRCSSAQGDQDFGPLGKAGKPLGRNGIEAFKVSGVSIENLTACNFLNGAGGGGNEIWFNGGDGSGKVGMGRFLGRYLSATSTYYKDQKAPVAAYGIFASNVKGPGLIDYTYASNMNDSSYYVGACPDCNTILDHAHAQYSILGYSGTNSGGHLVLENSEWDHNGAGIVTNSQNNDDAPSPQLGTCPGTSGSYCTFFENNDVHDNNNPNTPGAGSAALAPIGTGIVVAGGRFDTIQGNHIHDNGAWGVLLVPYPDNESPPPVSHCEGGTPGELTFKCYYDDWGNRVLDNVFAHNGYFGNPSNGDTGELSDTHTPGNCYQGNTDPGGFTSDPPAAQTTHADCGAMNSGEAATSPLGAQVICDTQLLGPCPASPGFEYPRQTKVAMPPLARQPTMPNPCKGVPANPWCGSADARAGRRAVRAR